MTPYLFLDFDGVLNALDGLNRGDWGDFTKKRITLQDDRTAQWQKYTIRVSRSMCDALISLGADTRWVTTWEHRANFDFIRELTGFPELAVAAMAGDDTYLDTGLYVTSNWKWEGVKHTVSIFPRPVIWIDDDSIPDEAADWFRSHGIPALLISPNVFEGVRQSHVEAAQLFIDQTATWTKDKAHAHRPS